MLMSEGEAEPAAFFERLSGDEFRTTSATGSPWDPSLQHGGPPAALLARAAEHARPDDSMRIARITVDMLGGIPQGVVRTEARVVRPGKRVELIEARLFVNGKLAVTGTVWRLRVSPGSTAPHAPLLGIPALPGPQPENGLDFGYGRAIDWRFVTGGQRELGPSEVWARPRLPLVEGEKTTPTERLLLIADSVNGLSMRLPMEEWLSIPPTLTVTVLRPPAHDWILVRSETTIGSAGIGIARGQIYDEDGFVAEVAQPLLVEPR